jgi:hypothetical protein
MGIKEKRPKAFGELPRTIGLYPPYPSLPQEIGVPILCIRVEWIHSNSTIIK